MEARLWRPVAQRRIRNVWSSIGSACSSWSAFSARGLASATALVNALLTHRYTSTMDLGALRDMDGLVELAQLKLARQQRAHMEELVTSYQELADITARLLQLSKSMRVYASGDTAGSPIAAFSEDKVLERDTGDAQGVPVFSMLNISCFEALAEEIVDMYKAELRIKWLLTSELSSIVGSGRRLPSMDEELLGVEDNIVKASTRDEDRAFVKREMLEVLLPCWLEEVNIRKPRVDEILALVSEEMQVQLVRM